MKGRRDAQARLFEELRRAFESSPFNKFLGVKVLPPSPGFARIETPYRPELIGDFERPSLHGGVLSALMDTTGGLAVWTLAGAGVRLSTVDLRIDFLHPAGLKPLVTEAHTLRVGNHVGVAELSCFHPDSPEVKLTTGIGVYNIAKPRQR